MQLGTRCSDGSCQAHEDLIAGFSAIETEAGLVQVRLKLCAATVVSSQQKRFQVADGFVQPMQIAGLIFFRVQRNAGQVPKAAVAVAFDFCTCRNSFADDLLKCFARDIFNNLHPREQSHAIFRAKDTTPTHSRCPACGSAGRQKCRVCPWHTDRSPRTKRSAADACGA